MGSLGDRMKAANALMREDATPHEGVLGRVFEEPEDVTRFPFQRDRDRILHSTAFRRLQGKTQVFVAGEGDHYRTRLTHTIEVAQISRDLARTLRLNEDLCECIALAHDFGHPPFGHAGEEALHLWMKEHGQAFEHNRQSHRIVTLLEFHSQQYKGLNLNREVIDGLLKHSTHTASGEALGHTLESRLANIADEIAYTGSDCDDGLRAGLFSREQLVNEVPVAKEAFELSRERGTFIRGSLLHILVHDLLAHSSVNPSDTRPFSFSQTINEQLAILKAFLWKYMYLHPTVKKKAEEGQEVIRLLCDHYHRNPPEKILRLQERTEDSLIDAIKDYVAGMTDSYAWLQAAENHLLTVIPVLPELPNDLHEPF